MTQREKILRHLQQFGSITPVEALREYGIMRLAARVAELAEDHPIESMLDKGRNRFGEPVRFSRYVLKKQGPPQL
jgi:hypothetical protein